jgi:hypothetical protein
MSDLRNVIEELKAYAEESGNAALMDQVRRLEESLGSDVITAGDISDSTGVAIGSEIKQTIIQIIYQMEGLTPEQEAIFVRELEMLEDRPDASSAEGRPRIELPPPSPDPRTRDHVFISYDHADRALVERLAKDLRERGHTTWIDFEGIRGGDVWRQAIVDGIYASAVVIVMLSPDAIASEWVRIEVQTALEYEKKLIPLLVRPLASKEDQAAWKALGIDHIQYRDFTTGYEPAFAELLIDLPRPDTGIPGHCDIVAAQLVAQPWGLDHYIQEQAKLLPIDASPYEDGVVRGQPENLIHRLWNSERVIVLGEPGIGKTVALERFAWELATNDPPIVPVLVRLLMYDGGSLLEWVRLDLVSTGEIKLKSEDETRRFLDDPPFSFCFLLDGLNEVRPAHREEAITEIAKLAMEFPRFPVVVTSRVQDECWRFLRQGSSLKDTLLVQPIDYEQAHHYLLAHLGEVDGRQLWQGLDDRMRGLATTPLMLWLIKEAWLEARRTSPGGSIRVPDNRGELYRNFVGRMLRRDDERGLGTGVPERERLAALGRLALAMHREQSLTIPYGDALTLVRDEQTIQAICVNGLLVGEKELRFAPHQTLQEHFAACALMDEAMAQATRGGLGGLFRSWGWRRGVLKYADDPWWGETFIQLAGLVDDPNALARAVAETNPWLAWWCVQEGRKVDDETRAVIERKSMALVRSDDVRDRLRAADTLGRIQTQRVAGPLMRLSLDGVPEVAFTALVTLRGMGEQVLANGWQEQNYAVPPLPPAERTRWLQEITDAINRPELFLDILTRAVLAVLPTPFEWCQIPAGRVEIEGQSFDVQPLFMAKYPITFEQFQVFVDDPQGFRSADWWQGLAAGADHRKVPGEQHFTHARNLPRERVSWYDAVAFCRWLSARTGYDMRLPTEWEWQWAAQGPDGRAYPWGPEYIQGYANINEERSGVKGGVYLERTTPVDSYPKGASPYDVLDMSGNVWEWCLNEYENPKNVDLGGDAARVVRGGSWGLTQGLRPRVGPLPQQSGQSLLQPRVSGGVSSPISLNHRTLGH